MPEPLEKGTQLPSRTETFDQARLVRYAGASTDFNPLHFDPALAAGISPTGGVIAHGMLNLGVLAAHVAEWAGGSDRILSLSAAFRAPCPLGATVTFGAEVKEVADGIATLAIWAETEDGGKVIDRRRSKARVRVD